MKNLFIYLSIFSWYGFQVTLQQTFFNNYATSFYNRPYLQRRNSLPNYRLPYNGYPNIRGPSNLASYVYHPQTPRWAVIYNRLATKRRQQTEALKRMTPTNISPFQRNIIDNRYRASNLKTSFPNRRTQVQQNRKLVKQNIISNNARLQTNHVATRSRGTFMNQLNSNINDLANSRTHISTMLNHNRNSFTPYTLPRVYSNSNRASINPKSVATYSSYFTGRPNPFQPKNDIQKPMNKITPKVVLQGKRNEILANKHVNRFIKGPTIIQPVAKSLPQESKESSMMSMPTKLILLQKDGHDNIYMRSPNQHPNRRFFNKNIAKQSIVFHPLSSTEKVAFKKSFLSYERNKSLECCPSKINKKSFITSNNNYNQQSKRKITFIDSRQGNNSLKIHYKKVYIASNKTHGPKLINQSMLENGWKRHHIFHPSSDSHSNNNGRQWTYKRYHIFHEREPSSKQESLLIPVAFDEDDSSLATDDDVDDDGMSFIEDENNDEDLPYVKPHPYVKSRMKIPIVNIETPNMNGLPDKIRQQIQATEQPVYKIVNGNVKTFKEIREPIFTMAPVHKTYKDVGSVRKSFVGDDSLFNDYVPNENEIPQRKMPSDKSKMSEEELEAFKEDQAANSLIKSADADKGKAEVPEVLGFDKQGITSADKNALSSHLGNPGMVDNSIAAGALVDSPPIKTERRPDVIRQAYKGDPDKYPDSESGMHKEFPSTIHRHSNKASSTFGSHTSSREKKKPSVGLVDKTKISDGDMDFHHPVSELDAIENLDKEKFNDYEQYGNRENEEQQTPRDDMDMADRFANMEHNEERNAGHGSDTEGMKPIEYTLKQGEENVDDAIRKLESGDSFDPDKLPPGLMDGMKKHFHRGDSDDDKLPPGSIDGMKKHFHRGDSDDDKLPPGLMDGMKKHFHRGDPDDDKLPPSVMDEMKKHFHRGDSDEDKLPPSVMDEMKKHFHRGDSDEDQEPVADRLLHSENQQKDMYHDEHDDHYQTPHRKLRHRDSSNHVEHFDHESQPQQARPTEQVPMSENNVDDSNSPSLPLKSGMNLDDVLDPEKAEERASHLSEQFELSKKLDKGIPDRALDLADPMKGVTLQGEPLLSHFEKPINENPLSHLSQQSHMMNENQLTSKQTLIDEPPASTQFVKPLTITDEMIPRNYRQKVKQASEMIKPSKELEMDSIKSPELSPEDALHALNNKKSINDILANIKDDDHYGPPDAVINAQFNNSTQDNKTFNINTNDLVNNTTVQTTNDITKVNGTILDPLTNLENVLQAARKSSPSSSYENPILNQSIPSPSAIPSKNISAQTGKKDSELANDLQISEIQNATVTKEVVSILESLGQLRPASNLTVPIENINNPQNTQNSVLPSNSNVKEQENKTKTEVRIDSNNIKASTKVDVGNNSLTSENSTEDVEEKETKEAVHDLNIAISILEKKLSLISAAKKSGNKKAIYIVDETLRNSKPVTKSVIATHKNASQNASSHSVHQHFVKDKHFKSHKVKKITRINLGKKKHLKKSVTIIKKHKFKRRRVHRRKHSRKLARKLSTKKAGL